MSRIDEVLERLRRLSPMPDDSDLTQEQIDEYREVIDELEELLSQDSDPGAIQPLLASFGYHDGYDLYQTTEGILIRHFSPETLLPHLIDAIQNGGKGPRTWAASVLGYSPDESVAEYLLPLLKNEAEYVRASAVMALAMIGNPSAREAIAQLQNDPSLEVRDTVEGTLENWRE